MSSLLDMVAEAQNTGVEFISVTSISTDGGTQMRAQLDSGTVAEYAEAMREYDGWGKFPPVTLFHDGDAHYPGDGFHRIAAFKQEFQVGNVPADVQPGTRRDAVLFAAGANADHGLRRTNADKRRAVEALLRDDAWGHWSDREIARRCNVPHPFVAKLRAELSGNDYQMDGGRTVNRGGTTYTMKPPETKSTASIDDLVRTVGNWLNSYADDDAKVAERIAILDEVLDRGKGGRESIARNSLVTDLNRFHKGKNGWTWNQVRPAIERLLMPMYVHRIDPQVGQDDPQAPQPAPVHQQSSNGVAPHHEPPAQPQTTVAGINDDGDAYRTVTLQLSGELCEWIDCQVPHLGIPHQLQAEYEATIGRVAREFAAPAATEPEPAELTDWRDGWTDDDAAEYKEIAIASEWYLSDITRFRVALRLAEEESDKEFRNTLIDHAEDLEYDGVMV